jgi:beta-phosphoglucomutase-like phosphatase (HAD superfamily)
LSRAPTRPTVLLFDVDGTLMTQKGVSRKAAQDAFGAVHGRADALDGVHFAGRTDPLIFGDGLRRLGLEVTAEALDAVFAAYLDILPGRMRTDPQVALLPGVRELLSRVRGVPGFAVGLGTGNIEAGRGSNSTTSTSGPRSTSAASGATPGTAARSSASARRAGPPAWACPSPSAA